MAAWKKTAATSCLLIFAAGGSMGVEVLHWSPHIIINYLIFGAVMAAMGFGTLLGLELAVEGIESFSSFRFPEWANFSIIYVIPVAVVTFSIMTTELPKSLRCEYPKSYWSSETEQKMYEILRNHKNKFPIRIYGYQVNPLAMNCALVATKIFQKAGWKEVSMSASAWINTPAWNGIHIGVSKDVDLKNPSTNVQFLISLLKALEIDSSIQKPDIYHVAPNQIGLFFGSSPQIGSTSNRTR